ncbi:MAG: cupredoxin domain-containing protein [Candidatus Pacebacteria bacterium]|jgi:plastocyanin domain-containing protein|nr:cupredoxin domain-containing protein [Candidatus Paceibacterota bacterium]
MQKNTFISVVLSIAIVGGALYFVTKTPEASLGNTEVAQTQNTEMRDGVQYVTLAAKGGYFPKLSSIKPDIPTKLIVKTSGTYDCSASLVVRSIGFQKVLAPTQEEIIDLGTPKPGEKIQGVCSMGMYNFQIKAE